MLQGSIFGHLLFSIYINDLSIISNTLKCIMHAGDTAIYFNTEDFPKDNLAKHITTELDKVDVWLKHNKLALTLYTLMTYLSAMVILQMTRFNAVVILLTTTLSLFVVCSVGLFHIGNWNFWLVMA